MTYCDYYNTDIPWVGKVPWSWKLIPNRFLFKKKQNIVGNKADSFQLLSLTTVGVKKKDIADTRGKVPISYESYQEVQPDDMIFCLFDLDVSAVFSGISHHSGMITSAYDVVECNQKYIIPQFADYWFRFVFSNRYYKMYAKNVRYTISYDVFGSINTPIPSISEQSKIVRYLDWKISQINKLIHGYQKQISLIRERTDTITCQAVLRGLDQSVELKESGIQNIGRIPAHWRILQNKRIFEERSEYSVSGDETLLSISKHYGVKKYHDLEDGEQFATIKPAESLVGYKKVLKNDLAMNIMRARNGSFGISDYDGIVSSAYAVFKPIIEFNPKYMHYLLRTPHVIGIFESYSYGIAEHRRRLYPVDFLRLYLPVPPINEQDKIAKQVEKEQNDAECILSKIQRQIGLLREYRTRLISDVVTGQVDVRGIVIPDYTPTEDTGSDSETGDNEEVVTDAE